MPRLIYLVTEDWFFCSHWLPIARAARAAGFEVAVACRVGAHRSQIEAEGFRVHPLGWRRRDTGPLAVLRAVLEIAALYRRERPALVHHFALKPVVLGGLALWLVGTPWRGFAGRPQTSFAGGPETSFAGGPAVINALTGLGFVFTERGGNQKDGGGRAGLLSRLVRPLVRLVLGRSASRLIVENPDDARLLVDRRLVAAGQVTVIRGAGIDTDQYQPLPEPAPAADGSLTVGYVGRLLEDKGVPVLVEAVRRLRARGVGVRLLLAGSPDPDNPTSVSEATLRAWTAEPGTPEPGIAESGGARSGIVWRGPVADVRSVWAEAAIAVLPSRREGLPKSLLEAAACARPLVATDVPGCREIAHAEVNALLVPPDDVEALARALETLVGDPARRARFAAASRRLVLSDLATGPVGARTVALYRELLGS